MFNARGIICFDAKEISSNANRITLIENTDGWMQDCGISSA